MIRERQGERDREKTKTEREGGKVGWELKAGRQEDRQRVTDNQKN